MLNFNDDKAIISLMKYNARWKQQKNPSDKIVFEVEFQIYDWNESFYSGISYKINFLHSTFTEYFVDCLFPQWSAYYIGWLNTLVQWFLLPFLWHKR